MDVAAHVASAPTMTSALSVESVSASPRVAASSADPMAVVLLAGNARMGSIAWRTAACRTPASQHVERKYAVAMAAVVLVANATYRHCVPMQASASAFPIARRSSVVSMAVAPVADSVQRATSAPVRVAASASRTARARNAATTAVVASAGSVLTRATALAGSATIAPRRACAARFPVPTTTTRAHRRW